MNKSFFFDTYALIEIGKNNPNYEPYREDVKIFISMLNLTEIVYFLVRENREDEIDEIFNKLSKFCISYDKEIITNAAKMKYRYKKEKLSMADCIGYELAKKHKCKFLTGDEKFREKENVEFVK
jgi:predicted nucleic acid-binding protein